MSKLPKYFDELHLVYDRNSKNIYLAKLKVKENETQVKTDVYKELNREFDNCNLLKATELQEDEYFYSSADVNNTTTNVVHLYLKYNKEQKSLPNVLRQIAKDLEDKIAQQKTEKKGE